MENSELDRKAHEALDASMEVQRVIISTSIDNIMTTLSLVMKDLCDAVEEEGIEIKPPSTIDISVPMLEAEMNGISLLELAAIKDEQFKNRIINVVLGHTNKAFEIGKEYGRLKLIEEARAAKKD